MRIVVMGTGGTGGYFGAKLARAGEDVTFVARGAHLEAIRAHGLRVKSAIDGEWVVKAPVAERLDGLPPADLVLFCVKSFDTERAGEAIKPVVGPGTGVLPVLNGVDNVEKLERILGPKHGPGHVMGGVAQVLATIEAPGVISHRFLGRLIFGEMDGRESERARAFLGACARAGIQAEMPLDRAQPVVDRVEQRPDWVGYGHAPRSAPRSQQGRVLMPLRPARGLRYHPRTEHRHVQAGRPEDLGGRAVSLPGQPEEQMPGADLLADPGCLPQCQLEALLGPGRERDVPARRFLARACQGRDLPAHGVQGHPGRPEDLCGGTALLPEQASQQVLGADVIVVQPPGLLLGQDNRPVGLVGEPLEHGVTPVSGCPRSVPPVCTRRAHPRRARNAAVLTRFWHEVEQYRRVPLREVST
jgi:hypothetical protein